MERPMRAHDIARLLTTDEVAGILRTSPWGVRRLVSGGRLRAIRLTPHGRLRFRAEEVKQLIEGE